MPNEPIDIEFTKCPNCGSEKRLGEEMLKRNPPPGAPPDMKAGLNTELKLLSEPLHAMIAGRAQVIITDYCFDCGTGYLVRTFEKGRVAS
ncbi:unnamed protein product [marine sediment metagenome]|uniref:Uncharacterized protein n=1 Tax=marine sediment metagenome TaxID=412755 RepID=X1LA85_9ZZZZ